MTRRGFLKLSLIAIVAAIACGLFAYQKAEAFCLPVTPYVAPADTQAVSSIEQPGLSMTVDNPQDALQLGINQVYAFLSDNEVYWSEKAQVGKFSAYDYSFDILAINTEEAWVCFDVPGYGTYTHNWRQPNPEVK